MQAPISCAFLALTKHLCPVRQDDKCCRSLAIVDRLSHVKLASRSSLLEMLPKTIALRWLVYCPSTRSCIKGRPSLANLRVVDTPLSRNSSGTDSGRIRISPSTCCRLISARQEASCGPMMRKARWVPFLARIRRSLQYPCDREACKRACQSRSTTP